MKFNLIKCLNSIDKSFIKILIIQVIQVQFIDKTIINQTLFNSRSVAERLVSEGMHLHPLVSAAKLEIFLRRG